LGGNKCRKLEYILGDARRKGVDTLVTSGSAQSNFALQLAAAARRLGMEPYLILVRGVHNETQGNLLLHRILRTNVTILDAADPAEMFTTMPQRMEELTAELRRRGRNPLVVGAGGATPPGTAGWVGAAEEISRQLSQRRLEVRGVVLANGSGSTQAGLALGFKHLGLPVNVTGISVLHPKSRAVEAVVTQANETAELLGLKVSLTPPEVTLFDDYIGQGYGVPTDECLAAIKLVAQTEGIFLDPIYTGKAMAGLIDLTGRGYFTRQDTVLFIHSGGVAADFAYHEELGEPTG
jgi:D-cysteine desulfhydrase family pyridoxal phosphate-dependent enzyme